MRIHDLIHAERFFLSDGGLETYLIFDKGYELPCFSAAVLLESEQGRRDLAEYYERFLDIARQSGRGFVLDAPTWRAGVAWAGPLGQSVSEVLQTNERAVRSSRKSAIATKPMRCLSSSTGSSARPAMLTHWRKRCPIRMPCCFMRRKFMRWAALAWT